MTRACAAILVLAAAACSDPPSPPPVAPAADAGVVEQRDAGLVMSEDASAADAVPSVDASAPDASASDASADPDAGVVACQPPAADIPEDTALRGPWPVGARTTTVAGLRAELWYPARRGSERGLVPRRYDVREHLPPADRGRIPDAENPWQSCDCYADLPIDDTHGPFPVVLFVHGTAAFRTQSASLATHWASRGFVVLAADHPGLELGDVLAGQFRSDAANEAAALLDALDGLDVAPQLDRARIGVVGHSAGGGAIAGLGTRPGVRVVMPLASRGVGRKGTDVSALIMGGEADGIARYSGQVSGYESTSAPKRLVGIEGAGHLAFSDLCIIGREGGGLLAIAQRNGVMVNGLIARLAEDGCGPTNLDAERGLVIVRDATAAALEEVLHCVPRRAAALTGLPARYAEVELRETLR